MVPLRSLVSSVLMFSLLVTTLHGPITAANADVTISPNNPNPPASEATTQETGLQFRLSEGVDRPEPPSAMKPATATHLSQGETEDILRRLPPMKIDPAVAQEFAIPERSLPPPQTGKTIDVSFPASTTAANEVVNPGPLEVVRYSPDGNVPLAPELSITFSQPMIVLTSQHQAATNVPVKLTPQPPGQWRWVGTKTLLFQPQTRFPMATTYNVVIPAGIRAANGSTLMAEKSWSFTTAPLTVKASYPSGDEPQPRDVLMFIEFDQRIGPVAVLSAIRVNSGGRVLRARLATNDEVKQAISRDPSGTAALREAVNDRWLAFRAIDEKTGQDIALALNTRIRVSVLSGAPSAEGPNPTQTTHQFSFSTHGPLKVTNHGCNGERKCFPNDSFEIEFNNGLADDFDKSKIRVEPALGEMETSIYGSELTIEGYTRGDTIYRVTLDKTIKDEFNQTLGSDVTLTFKVGPSPRTFAGLGDEFVVMDPAAPTRCSVFTINYARLKVRMYSVTPEDWPRWIAYRRNRESSKGKLTPPGRLISSRTIPIRTAPSEIVETAIDVSPALTNGRGQMILIVHPSGGTSSEDDDERGITESWIQVTNIGLDAFVDRTDLFAWTTSLKDGTPLSNVEVTLLPARDSAQSGSDGLARFALKPLTAPATGLIVARLDGDVAILPEDLNYWENRSGTWVRKEAHDSLRWFVFDDRKMYQPGEEVHIKGWIRRIGSGKTGDTRPLAADGTHVVYHITDSRGNQIKTGDVPLNPLGGFDLSLKLPEKLNLGNTTLKLQALSGLAGNTHAHRFQVQEFRRPEFEVKTQLDIEGPFFVGAGAAVSLSATYYAGGGLANAPVNWSVISRTTNFTPPNRGDYVFGKWEPWWRLSSVGKLNLQSLEGVTDAGGRHHLQIDFDRVSPARPATVIATANVSDVNRQRWSSNTTFLVHPADLYVGLKSDKSFIHQGEPLRVDAIVTDLDGKMIDGREIKMVATRRSWRQENGEWKEFETEPSECLVHSSANAVTCTFQPKEGGEYRVKATIRDNRERLNESELKIWVSGAKSLAAPELDEEIVELIPDRQEYRIGDTAEILVQAPFYPAEGVLTVRRSGILKLERFRMEEPTSTLQIQVEEGWIPNVHVQVDLLGEAEREGSGSVKPGAEPLPKKPAFASGSLKLSIPPVDRRLSITVTPSDKTLEPGAETSVIVDVKNVSGVPVEGGEVAVVVVDEAVLALTNYKLEDLVSVFYPERRAEVEDVRLRNKVRLSTVGVLRGDIGLLQGREGRSALAMGGASYQVVLCTWTADIPWTRRPIDQRVS